MTDLTDDQLVEKIVRSLRDNSADFRRARQSHNSKQSHICTTDIARDPSPAKARPASSIPEPTA